MYVEHRASRFPCTIVQNLVAGLVGLAITTASGLSAQTVSRFPSSTQLDDGAIREAVALGERQKPEPYWLYPKPGPRKTTAAVYTPFIRVALAAHTASRRGESVAIGKLPMWVLERDVHIVMRPQNTKNAEAGDPEDASIAHTPMTQIALAPRGRVPSHNGIPPSVPFLNGIPPKWMTHDLSYLDLLGGVPFADAVAAAAFDPEVMVQDVDVFGWWRKENHFFPSHGFLDPDEMKNWR